MKLRSVLLWVTVLQAGIAWAAPSSASGAASLGNLQIGVIDLAPDDNIAPSYAWRSGAPWTKYGGRIDLDVRNEIVNGWLPEVSLSFSSDDGTTQVSLSGGTLRAAADIESDDHAGEATAHIYTGIAENPYQDEYLLKLSPYTRITVTADATAWLSQMWGVPSTSFRPSYSGASLLVRGGGPSWNFDDVFLFPTDDGAPVNESRQLSVTFFNDTASFADVQLRATVVVSAHLPLPVAVPESSTWLLIATGLCGLAWRGRRGWGRKLPFDRSSIQNGPIEFL
ncbi:PEP-CTERM sorting domain-containing protein [Eleftheria terrae]|uniref:PEP-CTERM sorting domain-containing protein n=1 Tax=Eleftheria terrae TaxID=1597781 RepID=UPI00263B2F4F|nr:PEP-CTERM sorting domain-containing protein [Eleftheria terrae]WKB52898.1 PEP-CTERM sorting domain-containing protein [Eleftheria terrae]